MTPAQHAAYQAVCEADPECRCPLVDRDKYDQYQWPFVAAAITDHLSQRLERTQQYERCGLFLRGEKDNKWGVERAVSPICDGRVTVPMVRLSALLASHCVRLDLPRELIQKMEEA